MQIVFEYDEVSNTVSDVVLPKEAKNKWVLQAKFAGAVREFFGFSDAKEEKSRLGSVNSLTAPDGISATLLSKGGKAGRIAFVAKKDGKAITEIKTYSKEQLQQAWDNYAAQRVLFSARDGAISYYACETPAAENPERNTKKISGHPLMVAHMAGFC